MTIQERVVERQFKREQENDNPKKSGRITIQKGWRIAIQGRVGEWQFKKEQENASQERVEE